MFYYVKAPKDISSLSSHWHSHLTKNVREKGWRKVADWPEPRRLGAYSARSTARSHSMTRWLVHRLTSTSSPSGLDRRTRQFGSKFWLRSTYNCIQYVYFIQNSYLALKTIIKTLNGIKDYIHQLLHANMSIHSVYSTVVQVNW